MTRARWMVLIAHFFLALLAAAPALADRPVSERVDADSRGSVEVSNVAGSVVVRGWDRAEVSVEGSMGDDVETVRVERRGARTVVKVKLPEGRSRGRRDLHADLEIRVPAGSSVETSTVSATQDVVDVAGSLDLHTVSGGITVAGRPERIAVETVSGKVRLDAETGSVRARSVSGTLELRGRAAEVEASTVSGRVELATRGVERLKVESVSTSIDLDLDLVAAARVSASSHSGSLTLRLDDGASAEIRASTFSGDIDNDLGPPAERPRYGPGAKLAFTLGAGDGRIDLSTFSGGIRIRAR